MFPNSRSFPSKASVWFYGAAAVDFGKQVLWIRTAETLNPNPQKISEPLQIHPILDMHRRLLWSLCLLAVETIEPAEPLNSSQEVLSSTNSENLSQQHHVVPGYPLEQDLPAKAGQVSARPAQAGTSWNFWHQLKTRPCSTPAQHPGFARGRSQEPGPPYPAALRDAWWYGWYGSNLFGCSTTTLKEIWSPRLLGLERSSVALH